MKNAKRWLGYVIMAVIVILAVSQFLKNNDVIQLPQSAPAGQETITPDDQEPHTPEQGGDPAPEDPQKTLDENGSYTSKEDVALYLHTYGHLPDNFITKNKARELGWPDGGSLEPYAPGKCIGGDRFNNYEKKLPEKSGRTYKECDIDTLGASSRGPKRIVFSNDGLIYYTDDHYNTFTLLYGEEAG